VIPFFAVPAFFAWDLNLYCLLQDIEDLLAVALSGGKDQRCLHPMDVTQPVLTPMTDDAPERVRPAAKAGMSLLYPVLEQTRWDQDQSGSVLGLESGRLPPPGTQGHWMIDLLVLGYWTSWPGEVSSGRCHGV
jgi:hypothetical protein